jgi:ATP/maltotriose-dependent transcriptional regulator MalT/DNA-binding SARP family transcriptional activator
VSEFPLQAAKVQRPALRAETLQRDRLLDWLAAQDQSKVILVTAEAGYGKTTLLADFSRRTRRRVLWFRVDEKDRSWVSVVRYLIAAGQEVDPDFGRDTRDLISRLGQPGGPRQQEVVASLVKDYGPLCEGGDLFLILDDYHLVDDVLEVRDVLNEFIAKTPEALTIVLAGRRPTSLLLARLRSSGAVAEMRTDDLRFDVSESERLFRDTYHRALDHDLLADLNQRIDGWAACLQLVQAALRDRSSSEVRSFIAGLSGATGDLHDYLAEEVVGVLGLGMQRFLMRSALLQSVYPKLAAVVGEVDDLEAGRMVADLERMGLLNRRSDAHTGGRRYHPLVQQFLEARLRREAGDGEVIRLHRRIANYAAASDWRLAAHHFAAAGDVEDLHRLLEESLPSIMAGGDFALAETFIDRVPDGRSRPIFDIVLSRMELLRGGLGEAVQLAESALASVKADPQSHLLDQAMSNLASIYSQAGELQKAQATALELSKVGRSEMLVAIGRATTQLFGTSIDGDLETTLDLLRGMAHKQRISEEWHYFGITQINVGEVARAMGHVDQVLDAADAAIAALSARSANHEIGAAHILRSWALAHRNEMSQVANELKHVLEMPFESVRDETRFGAASVLMEYGDHDLAKSILMELGPVESMQRDLQDQLPVLLAGLDVDEGAYKRARARLENIRVNLPHREAGFKARVLTTRALAAVLAGDRDAGALVEQALVTANGQGSGRWAIQAEMLKAALAGDRELERLMRSRADVNGSWVSANCELFVSETTIGNAYVRSVVEQQVMERPERWRPALRLAVSGPNRSTSLWAAGQLDVVGEPQDVQLLRTYARQHKRSDGVAVGRGLARRIASQVHVADLGRVQVRVGPRRLDGDHIRRKVLALLCYLMTRPNLEAARDQVVDALWPDQDPTAASNSLNQTVYFLRRVFEPNYVDDFSPGFLHHETDVLWLDADLVSAESLVCRGLVEEARTSTSWDAVERLSKTYVGRFALDFEYEEWSAAYRDNLHASYLEVIERAIEEEVGAARYDRALELCRRALDVDPSCDSIERHLLRLYRTTGAHAAAEKQYRHYASAMAEEIGVVAPPLSDL